MTLPPLPDSSSTDPPATLHELEGAALRGARYGREAVEVGPFLAVLHPTSDMVWLSYALPWPGASVGDVNAAVVAALRDLFRGRGRVVRLEYFEPLWPDLGPALERHGFMLQGRMPLMACTPGDLIPARDARGAKVRRLGPGDDPALYRQFVEAGLASFGESRPATDAEVAELAANVRDGAFQCAYVSAGGAVVGVGTVVPSGELAGVGTLAAFRRRGIARAISAALVADRFAGGAAVAWLSAGDAIARAVYAGIGFRDVGAQLNYIDAPAKS